MKYGTLSALVLIAPSLIAAEIPAVRLTSPDGHLAAEVFLDASGSPAMTVKRDGVVVLRETGLELKTADSGPSSALASEPAVIIRETFPVRGAHARANVTMSGTTIRVKRRSGSSYAIALRVADDGVAFRYELPAGTGVVSGDGGVFGVSPGSVAWAPSGDEERPIEKHEIAGDKPVFGKPAFLPVTFKLKEGGYLALLESGRGEFPGLRMVADLGAGRFASRITGNYTPSAGAPVVSPWRVALITPTLDRLVNADLRDALAPAPDAALFPNDGSASWISPGLVAWSWMGSGGQKGITLENQKAWADAGAKLGYPYLLVDEGWSHWDADGHITCGNFYKCSERHHGDACWTALKELISHTGKLGMKVWLWHAYDDRFNIPGIRSPEARRAFFKRCHDAGVVGLKIDFFPAPTQETLRWQMDALRDAAAERLMLVFHGCGVPAGETRTWPNEMSREGVRGLEYGGGGAHITDIVSLPFTRHLAGHADFTPLSLGSGKVSDANHAAFVALVDSPAMHFCDSPASIAAMGPGPAKLITGIPLTWDETRVLAPSEIGEVAVFARRKGATWWLAAVNGPVARKITVSLDFLPPGARPFARLADKRDSKNLRDRAFDSGKLTERELTLDLRAGGGALIRFD